MKNSIPSMPFYPNEFISETMFLSSAETGQYIKLLCALFLHGRLSRDQIASLCGSVCENITALFDIDENGLYYKQRLEQECEKRENYLKARLNKKAASEKRKAERTAKKEELANNNMRTYGPYNNVALSDEEHNDLCNRFGAGAEIRIKALSTYMKMSGKNYKSHYAVIIHWEEKSKEKLAEDSKSHASTFDTDDFWEAAVEASKESMKR